MPSNIEKILSSRLADKKAKAVTCAKRAVDRLKSEVIETFVVGSLAYGQFMLHSDVDFLVTSHLDSFARAHAERLVSREMGGGGIGYDIIYADDVRPECFSEFCDAKLAGSDLFELANEIDKFGPGDAKPD